jgi:phosphohistidine phosphatase SixA
MEKSFFAQPLPEKAEQKEVLVTPSIRLEFFRHSKQGPQTEGMQEYQRRLTEDGRAMATEAGKTREPNPEMGLVYGSPRERSQETAYRQILANQEEVKSDSSLEDIEELIKNELPVGQKKIIDERLNFNWDGSQKFNEVSMKHFTETKDTLKFLVEESDDLVVEAKDKVSSSYSRCAANTAEIIQKYLKILPNWEKAVQLDNNREEQDKKDYAKNNNELQRFLGSHGATVENFILKLIDKTEGREAVLKFIENLPDKNNFQFNDGYSVCLHNENNNPKIEVTYHDLAWSIEPKLLDEFINDSKDLTNKIEKS